MIIADNEFEVAFPESIKLSDEQLFALCQSNEHLRIEREANGNLIFMTPSGTAFSGYHVNIITELEIWNRKTKAGIVFDSSAGFILPNEAMRAPDVSWVQKVRWETLSKEQKRKFAPICPDVVIEIKSASDNMAYLQKKMEEYRENGARLGWLIDVEAEKVLIFKQGEKQHREQDFSENLFGEDVLAGFEVNLKNLFRDNF